MFLTTQIIKRLSISAGFTQSIKNIEFIKIHIDKYMDKIIFDLIKLVKYSNKNTITSHDINVLYHINPTFYNILHPNGLKNNFKYSHTKPFKSYIKTLITKHSTFGKIQEENPTRLSPDALILLLEIVELYLLEILIKTKKLFNHSSLLEKDLKLVFSF